ncbi:MAG: lamin tail domain-containing protein [Bacteroidales bacterium]|nr:lamin tail domain-containing protein [Bacteroidales bacterium]
MKPIQTRSISAVIQLLVAMPLILTAQLHDSFSDGDFTDNPEWTGDVGHFTINTSFQLQLNSSGSGTVYLNSVVETSGLNEWRVLVNLTFSPSDNNNARIYLVSDLPDLSEPLNGYFLKLGESGSADAIELYRQSGTALYLVCRGTDGALASPFNIRIRVVRTPAGQWNIYSDPSGGENFRLQASGENQVWDSYNYFGISCKYTSSNADGFLFDDVYAGPLLFDDIIPQLLSAEVTGEHQVVLRFSEPMDENSVSDCENYLSDQGLGNPATAMRDNANASMVTLTYSQVIIPGIVYNLTVSGVADLAGNLLEPISLPFALFEKRPFAVVISEIMADPDPATGLPAFEYLELYNRSSLPVRLDNWILSIGETHQKLEPSMLAPNEYLIMAEEEAAPFFAQYGNVMAISEFSLLNSGALLVLRDDNNAIIHAVYYSDAWYQNEIKEKGGWSLEQVDPGNPCAGSGNWRASEDPSGGTPGSANSVTGPNPDETIPEVAHITIVGESSIELVFNEPMDSLSIIDPVVYSADQGLGNPVALTIHPPDYRSVTLGFNGTILKGTVYVLTIDAGFTDCASNVHTSSVTARFAIPSPIEPNDIVINEVLYDPGTLGSDFVEIYNRSEKVADLKSLWLAGRDATTGEPESVKEVCPEGRLMFPGEYLVLTSGIQDIWSEYFSPYPAAFVEMKSFPSFPNGEGTVVLFTPDMQIIDEFAYTDDLQFALLNSTDGVSLERVNFERPASDQGNWHSASANAGYATPGYQNSQFMRSSESNDEISITPEIFSPDNDGNNDLLCVGCNFSEPGYAVTIRIFDSDGRQVRVPVKNEPAGTTNLYYWDGITEDNLKAPIGIYIIYVEAFNLSGEVRQFKKVAVLGAKL